MKKLLLIILTTIMIIILSLYSCTTEIKDNSTINVNYKQEMRNFVKNISSYAKSLNQNFIIIPQNGVELITSTGEQSGEIDYEYLNAINGVGQEDLFYGYYNDDEKTPTQEHNWIDHFLKLARDNGKSILVTDYCSTHTNIDNSYMENNKSGYISFAANHRALDNIPDYPMPIFNENSNNINNLSDAKNFLYLINPDNIYHSSEDFINAIKNTNYDIIIMDLFFDGNPYSYDTINSLKLKSNGGKRLVICYMSIGEAEDYRYYWKSDWEIGNPSFIVDENPDWPGNYVVKYWDPEWQKIIYGNDDSYLKKIINSGFDGVYLDIIDAFEWFENNNY